MYGYGPPLRGCWPSATCGWCDETPGDLAVVIGGRSVGFRGLNCAISFLEDLFEKWERSVGKARLN